MKKRLLRSLQPLASKLPLEWLVRISGQKLFLPFYHSVQKDQPLAHIQHLYQLRSLEAFEKDLDFLLRYYQPIDLASLMQHLQAGEPLEQRQFFLSFDDGLREVYDWIAPLLLKKGIPATFFLNSAFVDNQDLFFRYKASLLIEQLAQGSYSKTIIKTISEELDSEDFRTALLKINYQNQGVLAKVADLLEYKFEDFLATNQPYMTTAQIQQLLAQGFTVGSHSIDHPLYKNLSLEDQLQQTRESQDFINRHFSPSVKAFAFPFTDDGIEAAYFNQVQSEGLVDISFGTAGLKQDSASFHLQRFPVEAFPFDMHQLVSSEYFYYFGKALLGKNKIKRK